MAPPPSLFIGDAHIHAFSGDAALAEDYAIRALRLSPFDPFAFAGHFAQACVRIRDGRFDEAAAHMARAVQANPRFSVLYFVHAAALALAGRIEDSKAVAKRRLELEPTFRIGFWELVLPRFMLPELWRPMLPGMRLAGVPE